MKKILTILLASSITLIASAYTLQAIINWKIDSENALVKFTINAHGQDLVGNFKGAKGEIRFDENDLENSSFNCTIDVATINTGIEGRDKHLQAPGFFGTEKSPISKFNSAKIEKTKEGFTATGSFLLKETTKEVSIPFVYEGNGETGVFKGTFRIKRSDYMVGKPDDEISDDVLINLEIPVTKEK